VLIADTDINRPHQGHILCLTLLIITPAHNPRIIHGTIVITQPTADKFWIDQRWDINLPISI
jgi:hypothetical protein